MPKPRPLNHTLPQYLQLPINGRLACLDSEHLINLRILNHYALTKRRRGSPCMTDVGTFLYYIISTVYCKVLKRKTYLAALVKVMRLKENYSIYSSGCSNLIYMFYHDLKKKIIKHFFPID